MKLNKENIKQIALIITGILFIGIGYFNYSFDIKDETIEVASREENANEINLGDVQLVNSEPENIYEIGDIVPNEELAEANLVQENLDTSNENMVQNNVLENSLTQNYDYFEETKIERERMYSEMIETYQKLIDSSETPNDQKAISVQEISNIANIKNGIMISENLIKNKGFEDVVILVNNGTVSVVVKSYTLNKEQISKIQNIIERELNVEAKNINISNKF